MRNRLLLLVLSCLLLMLSALPVGRVSAQGASQSGITMTATAGFGDTGAYLIGEWVPVRVTLNNPPGGQSRRVTVQAATGYNSGNNSPVYQREIDLPSPSRKEITLYVADGNYARYFVVKLFDGSNELDSINVSTEPFEALDNMIIGVVSSDSSLLNALDGEEVGRLVQPLNAAAYGYYGNQPSGGSAAATVAHITLADLPALSEALNSLGAIVLDNVDTGSLLEEQKLALEAWVARGGTLIATYRAGGGDTLAGLGALSPVDVQGSRDVTSLQSLSDLVATPLTTTGSVSIGQAQIRSGLEPVSHTSASVDGTPLLVTRQLGQGQVVYLGLSPSLPPLRGWDGTVPLMQRTLSEHALRVSYGASLRTSGEYAYYGGFGSGVFQSYGGVFSLPGLEMPDPWLIGLFLLVYIIIVGPVNFIVLRRMRRAELAWITIPVLVALFSGAAYVMAIGSKGGDVIAIRANVIRSEAGTEVASLSQHFGVYSPFRRTYSVGLNADSVFTELAQFGYYANAQSADPFAVNVGNGTTRVDDVNVDTWNLRGFLAEHSSTFSQPLEADLHLGDNEIIGTVTNRTNGPLQDVALIRGRATEYVGFLAPGESRDIELTIGNGTFDNSSSATLLPPPPGVTALTSSYYYSNDGRNNVEQRRYERRVALLSSALFPLVQAEPPLDMSVTLVAWGPAPASRFDVPGYATDSEEINIWTGSAPVRVTDQDQPVLDAASVPYVMYAPGNNPAVLPSGQVFTGVVPGGVPYPSPTSPAQPGMFPPRLDLGVDLVPYVDVRFALPSGTKPTSLTFKYSLLDPSNTDEFRLLAYNVEAGTWDAISDLERDRNTSAPDEVRLPNPVQYTDTSGRVTLRIWSSEPIRMRVGELGLSLNDQ